MCLGGGHKPRLRRTAHLFDTMEVACHLEDIKRLHCYAASGNSHHPPAYCCAIAIACAQDILIALLVALAGMAIQVLQGIKADER